MNLLASFIDSSASKSARSHAVRVRTNYGLAVPSMASCCTAGWSEVPGRPTRSLTNAARAR